MKCNYSFLLFEQLNDDKSLNISCDTTVKLLDNHLYENIEHFKMKSANSAHPDNTKTTIFIIIIKKTSACEEGNCGRLML